jgi:PAS domain S-box-containing protein
MEKIQKKETRILFVDDDPTYRRSFKYEMHSEKAYLIEMACDGKEALDKLESFAADIVISDLKMPHMDGLELLEKIRIRYPDALVLLITAIGNVETVVRAMKLGAYDFIQKPLDFDMVKMIIKKAVAHQRIQQELAEARDNTRLLGSLVEETVYVMIFITDANGTITMVNALAASALGYTKEELLKCNMDQLFKLNDAEIWQQIAEAVYEDSRWRGELEAVSKEGGRLSVDMAASRAKGEVPSKAQIICFVSDLSQRKALDHMKAEFVAVASHELRTPLTSIKNAVDIIMGGKTGAINEKQEHFIFMAKRNVDKLCILVEDMFDIFQMESGKMVLHFEQMDIKDCIIDLLNTYKPLAEKKSILLEMAVDSNMASVYANKERIKQVLANLVDNAIKFTPEKGAVTIQAHQRIEKRQQRPQRIQSPKSKIQNPKDPQFNIIQITVTDNGIGIPAGIVDRIFDKFYQAESTLSTEERVGMGLGLALCKYTVEAHGGSIWCKSTKGKGSTFGFTLPVE